ncbi:MAG: bifunctional ornithine acetyltransferase/N-acetylglutamate synthase [Clostridiales bacterium]|nr:bifunctional ornithine acetyltransferase/N-acetylglutamate synthase [Clostridiales bacterium]
MDYIDGGVCAAKGFTASGIHCGIRKNKSKRDLALIYSEKKASAAGIYTLNLVKGAPIEVTKKIISDGTAQAVICNSGNANTCNADGKEVAEKMCVLAGKALNISPSDVIVASTGVIGVPLDISPIENGMSDLAANLGSNNSRDAAEAIMTTDTAVKEFAVSFKLDGKECKIGGIAKGSGMIHPNLATMLVFITTDAAISPDLLHKALYSDAQKSFNMISIDGDTSTNDMVVVLANGMAGNAVIDEENEDFNTFKQALAMVTEKLCRAIAKDGEGATRLLECCVKGGKDWITAKTAAKSVVCSNLVKSMIFGADANCGRILCALGYSGADIKPEKTDVSYESEKGRIDVCKNGIVIPFDEDKAKEILLCDEIKILVDLKDGDECAVARGCDLTYDYVKINGDYRT